MSSIEEWKGKELVFSVDRDLKNVISIECPRCGGRHRIDDPEEQRQETLYCDTHRVRIPFPNRLKEWIKESSVTFHASLDEQEQGVKPKISAGRKYVGVELVLKF